MDPIPLTLNSFREFASIKGDANVQMDTAEKDRPKLASLSRKVRQVEGDKQKNLDVRRAFYGVIENSRESAVLSPAAMGQIRKLLGIPAGPAGARDPKAQTPLSRRVVREVLQIIDTEATTDKLVAKLLGDLKARIGNEKLHAVITREASRLFGGKGPLAAAIASPEAMVKHLPKGFRDLTKDQLKTFVRNNFAVLKARMFEDVYWEVADCCETKRTGMSYNAAERIARAVAGLLADYAEGRDSTGPSRSVLPVPQPPPKIQGGKDTALYESCGLKALDDGLKKIASVRTGSALADSRLMNLSRSILGQLRTYFNRVKDQKAEDVKSAVASTFGDFKAQLEAFLRAFDLFNGNEKDNAACQKSMVAALSRIVSLVAPSGETEADACTTLFKALKSWNSSYAVEGRVGQVCDDLKISGEAKTACCAELSRDLARGESYRQFLKSAFSHGTDLDADLVGNNLESAAKFDAAVKEKVGNWKSKRAAAAQKRQQDDAAVRKEIQDFVDKIAPNGNRDNTTIKSQVSFFSYSNPRPSQKEVEEFKQQLTLRLRQVDGLVLMGTYIFGASELVRRGIEVESGNGKFVYRDMVSLEKAIDTLNEMLLERGRSYGLPLEDLSRLHEMGLLEVLRGNPGLRDALTDGILDVKTIDENTFLCCNGMMKSEGKVGPGFVVSEDKLEELFDYFDQTVCTWENFQYVCRADILDLVRMTKETCQKDPETSPAFLGQVKNFFATPEVLPLSREQLPVFLRELKIGGGDLSEMTRTLDGQLSLFALLYFTRENGGPLGLAEYCGRVLGKKMSEVGLEDVAKAEAARKNGKTERDLMADLLEKDALANVLAGKKVLSQYAWEQEDLLSFRAVLLKLEHGDSGKADARFGSKTYAFEKLSDGEATVTTQVKFGLLGPVKTCSFRLAKPVAEMRKLVDTALAREARSLADLPSDKIKDSKLAQCLLEIVDGVSKEPGVRQREIYNSILAGFGRGNAADNAGMPLDTLCQTVKGLLQGSSPEKPQNVAPDCLNSAEAVEMYHEMLETENADELVRLPPTAGKASLDSRLKEPNKREIRNFAADLLSSQDSWESDDALQGGRQPQAGERIRRVLQRYAPEISHLKKNPALLDAALSLPEVIRDGLRGVVKSLLDKIPDPKDTNGVLDLQNIDVGEIEGALSDLVKAVTERLQEVISGSFTVKKPSTSPVWQRPFAELVGGEGIDLGTTQGAIANKILKAYFTKSAEIDRRRMISAIVRNTSADDKPGKVVAELLKAAGPLMQKLLQGLPPESFSKDMQAALADMKSRLPPIADDAVKAQMLALIKASNGSIRSITVHKSLGAASVGQAFLCTICTPDFPNVGLRCVIKLLRPTAAPAISREKKVFDEILDPGERKDFEGRYAGILLELDFTNEAQNIDVGAGVYEKPRIEHLDERQDPKTGKTVSKYCRSLGTSDDIHSMSRLDVVSPTTNALIGSLAPGETIDGCLQRLNGEIDRLITREEVYLAQGSGKPNAVIVKRSAVEKGGPVVESFEATSELTAVAMRRKLHAVREKLVARYKAVDKLLYIWFHQAVFGSGKFFHGDLHAGNIMADDTGLTVIDYGNCQALSDKDRSLIANVVIAATAGNADRFLSELGIKNPDEQLKSDVGAVLKKGLYTDVLSRIQGALTLCQQSKHATPPVLTNFFEGYTRLANTLLAIGSDIDRIEKMGLDLGKVAKDREDGENAKEVKASIEQVDAFKAIERMLSAMLGTDEEPYPNDNGLEKVLTKTGIAWSDTKPETRAKMLEQMRALGKEKTLAVLNSFKNRLTLPEEFLDVYKTVRLRPDADLDEILDAAKELFDELDKNPNADVNGILEKMQKAFGILLGNLRSAALETNLSPYVWIRKRSISYHDGANRAREEGLRAVSVIVGEVIDNNQDSMSASLSWIAKGMAGLMKKALSDEIDGGDDRLDEQASYIDWVRAKNEEKRGDDRLTDVELKQIEGLVRESFAFPPMATDRFSSKGFLKNPNQVELFFDMLSCNLDLLKKRFGGVQPRHVDYAFSLLALSKSKAAHVEEDEKKKRQVASYDFFFGEKEENFLACLRSMKNEEFEILRSGLDSFVAKRGLSGEQQEQLRTVIQVLRTRPPEEKKASAPESA